MSHNRKRNRSLNQGDKNTPSQQQREDVPGSASPETRDAESTPPTPEAGECLSGEQNSAPEEAVDDVEPDAEEPASPDSSPADSEPAETESETKTAEENKPDATAAHPPKIRGSRRRNLTRKDILQAMERLRVMQFLHTINTKDASFQLKALQAQARLIPEESATAGNTLRLTPELREAVGQNPGLWEDLFPFLPPGEMEGLMNGLARSELPNEKRPWAAPPPKPGAVIPNVEQEPSSEAVQETDDTDWI